MKLTLHQKTCLASAAVGLAGVIISFAVHLPRHAIMVMTMAQLNLFLLIAVTCRPSRIPYLPPKVEEKAADDTPVVDGRYRNDR